MRPPPRTTLFPYTTLFRSERLRIQVSARREDTKWVFCVADNGIGVPSSYQETIFGIFKRLHANSKYSGDRKSTRLNSSHPSISYAVFCLKKKRSTRSK